MWSLLTPVWSSLAETIYKEKVEAWKCQALLTRQLGQDRIAAGHLWEALFGSTFRFGYYLVKIGWGVVGVGWVAGSSETESNSTFKLS